MVAKAARVDKAEKDLADRKTTQTAESVKAIIAGGKAEGKRTNELAVKLEVDYKENPEGLKALVATLPKQTRVTGTETTDLSGVPEKYRGKTWNELYLSGQLESLKAECPKYYKQLTKK